MYERFREMSTEELEALLRRRDPDQYVDEAYAAMEDVLRERAVAIPAVQLVIQGAAPVLCPFCKEAVQPDAKKCKHCGSSIAAAAKSNVTAGCLGLVLGPVGLWYKGQWAAGFAWLVLAVLLGLATGGVAAIFMWLGMAIHAAAAEPKG
jgi:hypothetical protein